MLGVPERVCAIKSLSVTNLHPCLRPHFGACREGPYRRGIARAEDEYGSRTGSVLSSLNSLTGGQLRSSAQVPVALTACETMEVE